MVPIKSDRWSITIIKNMLVIICGTNGKWYTQKHKSWLEEVETSKAENSLHKIERKQIDVWTAL